MISFEEYLFLNEKENNANELNKIKTIARTAWLNAHKDDPDAKNKIPKSITNAKDVSEIMDAIKNWKNSNDNILKTAYNKIHNSKTNNVEDNDDDDSENKDKSQEPDDEVKNELEDIRKQVEKALENPAAADPAILDSSEFVAQYDEKLASKMAELEAKIENNDNLIRKTAQENAEKRAENFKSVMEVLGDLLKIFLPDLDTGSLSKMGDNAVEAQKQKTQQENAIANFDSKVKDATKNIESEYQASLKSIRETEKLEIDAIKNKKGLFSAEIQDKCKLELDTLNFHNNHIKDIQQMKKEIEKQLLPYENKTVLTPLDKRLKKDLESQLNDIERNLITAKSDMLVARNKYEEKLERETKAREKDIEKWRENEIRKIKEKHDIERQELEVYSKKKKSNINNRRDEFINYLKFSSSKYPDQREMPVEVRKKLQEYQTKFQEALLSKEEVDKLNAQNNQIRSQNSQDKSKNRFSW